MGTPKKTHTLKDLVPDDKNFNVENDIMKDKSVLDSKQKGLFDDLVEPKNPKGTEGKQHWDY